MAPEQTEILRAVLKALGTLLPEVAQTVEASCRTLGTEVAVLAGFAAAEPDLPGRDGADRVEAALKARQSAGRAVMAMQFQDRHTQLLEDAAAMLRRAEKLLDGQGATTLEEFCAKIKMSDVRSLVLSVGAGETPALTTHDTNDIDLF